MAKPEIDQEKLRAFLRSLGNDDLLQLLDRAIGVLPRARLPALIKGYAKPSNLKPDEYARAANGIVDDFMHYDRDRYLRKARSAGDAAQKRALRMSGS